MIKLQPNGSNVIIIISAADAFQVRSLSQNRLIRNLGKLSKSEMNKITSALAVVLKII